MSLALLATSAIVYAYALVRAVQHSRTFPLRAALCFFCGLTVIGFAIAGPLDERADASLAWHMLQHLILVTVAAPLLVLGAPVRLALTVLPKIAAGRLARFFHKPPLQTLAHPAIAWLQFAAVLYAVHFSPLYEAALEHEAVHALEHLLFLASALIFWMPLLAVAPAPHAPAHPVRLLMIFMALPMSAFLGFAFYVSRHVLYAHYAAQPGALADQMNAGAVMWIAGGMPLFVALLWTVADWAARDRRIEAIADGLSR